MKTSMHRFRWLVAVVGLASAVCRNVQATDPADAVTEVGVIPGDKAVADPFLGDWQGAFEKGWPRGLVAQVIPRGDDRYDVQFLPAFDQRCPPLAVLAATVVGNKLCFEGDGWSGTFVDGKLTGVGMLKNKPTAFTLQKVSRLSPRLGAKPPENATVLFDGGSLDQWESDGRGGVKEITWKQIDDFIRVWPPLKTHSFASAIRTRDARQDFEVHLEFRLPLIAAATGQTRGNSGIIIEEFEFYEVQILDSYGLPGYWDETGAIYKKEAPKVNMCGPPGQWQSYDIAYRAPRFDSDGNIVAKARITVDLNGKRVHNDVELPYSEAALRNRLEKPDLKTPGRIILQHHGDPVDFRNIWIVECSPEKE
jgi:hypothetical protein